MQDPTALIFNKIRQWCTCLVISSVWSRVTDAGGMLNYVYTENNGKIEESKGQLIKTHIHYAPFLFAFWQNAAPCSWRRPAIIPRTSVKITTPRCLCFLANTTPVAFYKPFPYHPAAIVPMLNPVEMAILNRSLSRSGMECGKTLHGG